MSLGEKVSRFVHSIKETRPNKKVLSGENRKTRRGVKRHEDDSGLEDLR